MINLPKIPDGATVLGPNDVAAEMEREIAQMKADLASKKITPEEYDNMLRRMSSLKTTREDPTVLLSLIREIHHGSPHVLKVSAIKIKIPANNRICTIIPDGHDDSMDKDMSGDVGTWEAPYGGQ